MGQEPPGIVGTDWSLPRPAQALVEYSLIIVLIVLAVIAALVLLPGPITIIFSRIGASLGQ